MVGHSYKLVPTFLHFPFKLKHLAFSLTNIFFPHTKTKKKKQTKRKSKKISGGSKMGSGNCHIFWEILLAIILPPLGICLSDGCCSVSFYFHCFPQSLMSFCLCLYVQYISLVYWTNVLVGIWFQVLYFYAEYFIG